jgi:hypothetical protein
MTVPAYTLCKNPIQLDTLHTVQYLHSQGIDARPAEIYEINHPGWAKHLPAVMVHSTKEIFEGIQSVIEFLERSTGIADLERKSAHFKTHVNPTYRCNA